MFAGWRGKLPATPSIWSCESTTNSRDERERSSSQTKKKKKNTDRTGGGKRNSSAIQKRVLAIVAQEVVSQAAEGGTSGRGGRIPFCHSAYMFMKFRVAIHVQDMAV